MSEWSARTLGDLIHVKHGFAFKGEYFAEEGDRLVLKPGNFPVGGGIRLRPGKDNYYTGTYPPEFELSPGDMVVVMTDLTQAAPILGSPAFIPAEPVMLHNQRLGLVQIKPGVEVDKRFLYYCMLSDTSRSQIRATATGATVRHTAPERIYRVSVMIPPLPVQEIIGDVLVSIDDLIENNRRRVRVLEEMSRAIYREWFVKFRYPGHGDVPMVDSVLGAIPEGWSAGKLGDVATEVRDSVKPSALTRSLPYVPIDEIDPRSLTLRRSRPGEAAASSLRLFEEGDVLFGAMRAYFHKVCVAPFDGVTRSTCFVLRPNPEWGALPVFLLDDDETVAYASNHSSGSTIPYARWAGVLSERGVALPPTVLAAHFSLAVEPMLAQARFLARQGVIMASLRDRLLPKLVTGQIDVSALDLGALVEGAVA